MYKHEGKSRTLKHNIQIAVVLSMVAGLVNVTGFLYIGQLTTNVTGHFALFMNDVRSAHILDGLIYLVYIVSFLFGSFFSGLIMDWKRSAGKRDIIGVPIILESAILITLPVVILSGIAVKQNVIACILLFAMGMQNAFVTRISGTIVRTTHLTGLFTDLGIELSQLFYKNIYTNRRKIKAMIRLRLSVIFSFFAGGILAGWIYTKLEFGINTTIIGGVALILSLLIDRVNFGSAD